MNDDTSTPSIGEPVEAASPDANVPEQVAIAGLETKKPLVWVEEGEVKRLWKAMGLLKEELQAEFSASYSATEDKLRVCVTELEEKIKVIVDRTENEQENEASIIVNAVLTQHEVQDKQIKEQLNSLEDELSKTKTELNNNKDELNETKQKLEAKKSKLKDLKSNHRKYIEEKEEAIAKITGEIQRLNDLLKLKGDDIQEKDEKINELEEEFKIVKAELKEAKENAKKNAEEIKELPGALKAKEDQIQSLRDKLFKSENDRKYWKGKCEGLNQSSAAINKSATVVCELVHKIPDAVNRQRSHDSFVIESVSPSSNVTNADQGHLSNESDESD